MQKVIYQLQRGQAQPHVYADDLSRIKIPLPSRSIQKKIVVEIENLEQTEQNFIEKIETLRKQVSEVINASNGSLVRLENVTSRI